jgi:tetratricopeptide (TPR) repeat protein
MRFSTVFILSVLFIACQSELDKKLTVIQPYLKQVQDSMNVEKIPDSMAIHFQQFAAQYPQHKSSEKLLYAATLMAERSGRYFECGKWCEMYVAHYPGGLYEFPAMVAAAHNYEKIEKFDKAIEYYDKAAKKDPNSTLGKQCAQTSSMLKKGLITPEQQLEYILQNQKDTAR